MKLEGRDRALLERAVSALERNAKASEALIELATEEEKMADLAPPPYCPHCGALDPEVSAVGAGASGKLSEFVLIARCTKCHEILYGLPSQWLFAKTVEEAQFTIDQRAEA